MQADFLAITFMSNSWKAIQTIAHLATGVQASSTPFVSNVYTHDYYVLYFIMLLILVAIDQLRFSKFLGHVSDLCYVSALCISVRNNSRIDYSK